MIYFFYGLHNSAENRPLATYSQIISYGGNGVGEPIARPDENVHIQQPIDDVTPIVDQQEDDSEWNDT